MADIKMWRYYLPNERPLEGWAEVLLCSTGMFAVTSDYGDYAYAWRSHGTNDFRVFVANLANDTDYFMRKVGAGDKIYDGDATLKAVKRAIVEYRRSESWTKDEARREWDLLDLHNGLESREDFALWYDDTRIECAYELVEMSFKPSLVTFANRVLPRLREAIRAEMAMERLAAG